IPAQGSVQGGGQVWLKFAVAEQPLLSVTVRETSVPLAVGWLTTTALVASWPLILYGAVPPVIAAVPLYIPPAHASPRWPMTSGWPIVRGRACVSAPSASRSMMV